VGEVVGAFGGAEGVEFDGRAPAEIGAMGAQEGVGHATTSSRSIDRNSHSAFSLEE
jgi:hypothetical protein